MPELKAISVAILQHIATLIAVPMKGLVATMELLDEGATVPFIARYRA
jgi:protein Tex